MRVDFHTHIIPEDVPNLAERFHGERWPVLHRTCTCGANIMVGGKVFREVTDQVWDPQKRIHDMQREGVDMQVLSPIPVTFSYWAPAAEAEVMARIQNDFIAETVNQHPNHFIGLGTVPLQDTEVAIREMDRCMHELGLRGIEIGTNVNGNNLDDPGLIPFFEMCQTWDVPLFVHPWETLGRERMPRHNLMYTVGMPSETALAAASLILGGVIEKFPRLKICFAHGGGSFPYILPRLDQGWKVWPHLRLTDQPPSVYAKQFYFDSLTYDPLNIPYMMKRFGEDRIMMGSDYPFLLRETPPGDVIDHTLELTDGQKRALLGENALRFLNIKEMNGQ
ncbi:MULTISPECIES: amidohydrolase family protein [Brevibacillus]|uniref:2-amino-3-carboxymuconate-6-semialdehyde decarboxylase n=1 Tax=Brevibacillus porteri TaxID=2126350 RepID=A0ABX5FW24_9BACL|nr:MULTISPECIES: amidohydrolase family protein [Brevibacillus]MDC0759367.1 amidohydrolase family protein [Brevibacillus sp. AG]MED1798877.1 amidohydrolase family protein [Brevibacillus porteri]MED2131560.1 amidohydrolase family protein [Brevibacillus porteri]MED2747908.1 amidohydrolase family protein [Brevibacillus porteri]MED2813327.1 amidohydrolase family protein [Brevibacillus porteri]